MHSFLSHLARAAAVLAVIVVVLLVLVVYTDHLVQEAETRYPPAGQFISVNGYRLHYVTAGQGRPVVLFHGDGGTHYDFTLSPLYPLLITSYETYIFDRPGLGYSERPPDGGSPLLQARMMRQALMQLGVERPVLVGHSRGAAVALAYALEYPDEIAGLVLLGPAAYSSRDPSFITVVANLPVIGDVLVRSVYAPAATLGDRAMVRSALSVAFWPDGPVPADYLQVYGSFWARPGHIKATTEDRWFPVDILQGHRYSEIRVPVIILQGMEDRSVAPANAMRLRNELPHSRLILLPNTGHELMFFRPRTVAGAVQEIWQMAGE